MALDLTKIQPLRDGVPGDLTSAKLWEIIGALTAAEQKIDALQSALNAADISRVVVLAEKNKSLTIVGNGASTQIDGWLAKKNLDGTFNSATGVYTVPPLNANAVYDIQAKFLVTTTTATANPAGKFYLTLNGAEVAIAEESLKEINGANRQTFYLWASLELSAGATLSLQGELRGMANGLIRADINTMLEITRKV